MTPVWKETYSSLPSQPEADAVAASPGTEKVQLIGPDNGVRTRVQHHADIDSTPGAIARRFLQPPPVEAGALLLPFRRTFVILARYLDDDARKNDCDLLPRKFKGH